MYLFCFRLDLLTVPQKQSNEGVHGGPEEVEGWKFGIGQENILEGTASEDGKTDQGIETHAVGTVGRRRVGPPWRVFHPR